jgi:hypothetical protein
LKLVQVKFKLGRTREEYEEAALQSAKQTADFPGLVWKIWAYDDEENEAMGIYFFRDDRMAQMVLENIDKKTWPDDTYELEKRMWDVQEGLCKITRAPI